MLTTLTLYGWFPLTLGLFLLMPAKRAVLWSLFLSFLFLPMATIDVPGPVNLTKITASVLGIAAGVVLLDMPRLMMFRPRWFDLPYVTFTFIAPMCSSLVNGLGVYDGFAEAVPWMAMWLLPYLIGRLYFTTLEDARLVMLCVIFGALAYVPICLFEVRMSPQLHRMVYGYHQHSFGHAIRQGGFRPRGFMQMDLLTGMWMASGALACFWVWRSGTAIKLGRVWVTGWIATPMLAGTAFLCKTIGPFLLNVGGLGVLLGSWLLQTRWFMYALIVSAPVYMGVRAAGLWDVQNVINVAASFSQDRADSLDYRIRNETMLLEKAMQQPVFGWGGWGRSRVTNERGTAISVSDGMWILLLGRAGVVGLAGWVLALALPAILFVRRFPPGVWWTRSVAPLTAGAVLLSLYQLDSLLNAMENPINFLVAGMMMSCLASVRLAARPVAAPSASSPAHPASPRANLPQPRPIA